MNTSPAFFMTEDNQGRKIRGDLDRIATIKALESAHSFSDYMSKEYWRGEHIQLAEDSQLAHKVEESDTGKDTFELFADVGLGFHNLKPGQSIELNITRSWVHEYLKKKPVYKQLKIENLETSTEESAVDRAKTLEQMERSELEELAKEKDVRYVGVTTDKLVKDLAALE